MALSISTVLEVAGYIRSAIAIYNDIQAVPGEVAELKTQLAELGKPLSSLASVLAEHDESMGQPGMPGPQGSRSLAGMDGADRNALAATVKAALGDSREARDLFARLKSRHIAYMGGHDLQARSDWLARLWYRYGVGADRVRELIARIDKRRVAIQLALDIAGFKSQAQIQRAIAAMKLEQAQMLRLLESGASDRKALEDKVRSLRDQLARQRAEAKRAKERENIDKTASVTEKSVSLSSVPAPVPAPEKPPPGPGKLSKTPSMGPKVIRGKPEPAKTGEGKDRPTDSKGIKKKSKEEPQQHQQQQEQRKQPAKGDASTPVIVQVEPRAEQLLQVHKPARTPRPSPSPSPRPPRGEYSVMFVDPKNIGRSAMCHALLALLADWTRAQGSGGRVAVAQVHSAGFFVRQGSDCMDEIEGLEYATRSYRLPLVKGGEVMDKTACDVVFQQPPEPSLAGTDGGAGPAWWQGGGAKGRAALERQFRARPSTGMRRDDFRQFDYIVCFTQREHENLLRLRAALVAKHGKEARPKGKGRILHLGRYLSADGAAPREIVTLKGVASRENWEAQLALIKTALDGFLRQELKWEPPGAAAS